MGVAETHRPGGTFWATSRSDQIADYAASTIKRMGERSTTGRESGNPPLIYLPGTDRARRFKGQPRSGLHGMRATHVPNMRQCRMGLVVVRLPYHDRLDGVGAYELRRWAGAATRPTFPGRHTAENR